MANVIYSDQPEQQDPTLRRRTPQPPMIGDPNRGTTAPTSGAPTGERVGPAPLDVSDGPWAGTGQQPPQVSAAPWSGNYATGPGPRIDNGSRGIADAQAGTGTSDYERVRNLYNQYQTGGGQWQQYGVRSLQGMDLGGNNAESNPYGGDNVSEDSPGFVHPLVQEAIRRGIVRPEDAAAATWEVRNGGDLLYEPGKVRTFGTPTGPSRSDGITGMDPRLAGQSAAQWGIAQAQRGGTQPGPQGQPGQQGQYGGLRPPSTRAPMPGQIPLVDPQFDDPYTNQLERMSAAQLGQIRNNPALDQVLGYLQQQFETKSQTPGFTPEELAVLRTQAFEPAEAMRQASQQRATERTAARGILPSSGVVEQERRDIDTAADRTRTTLDRDLAINAIDRRRGDQSQAAQIAQMLGITIPGMQRTEELGLAKDLYQLPRTAMQDSLNVVNTTSNPNDTFNQSVQLEQQRRIAQEQADARQAAFMQQLGAIVDWMFG